MKRLYCRLGPSGMACGNYFEPSRTLTHLLNHNYDKQLLVRRPRVPSPPRWLETMPLYEYECNDCEHRFERIQKFSDPLVSSCPVCGGEVRKLLSSPAIQFKGTGWYVTDYAKKPSGEARDGDAKAAGDGKDGTKDGGSKGANGKDAGASTSKDASSSASKKDSTASASKSTSDSTAAR